MLVSVGPDGVGDPDERRELCCFGVGVVRGFEG